MGDVEQLAAARDLLRRRAGHAKVVRLLFVGGIARGHVAADDHGQTARLEVRAKRGRIDILLAEDFRLRLLEQRRAPRRPRPRAHFHRIELPHLARPCH